MSNNPTVNTSRLSRYGTAFFILCVVAVAWMCLMLVGDLRIEGADEVLSWPRLVAISLANALLLLSPYWLLPRRWRWLVWIPIILFSLWSLMQVCYCRAYEDMMPWHSLTLTENVNSTLMASTIALLRLHDLVYVIPVLLLAMVWFRGRPATGEDKKLKPFLLIVISTQIQHN